MRIYVFPQVRACEFMRLRLCGTKILLVHSEAKWVDTMRMVLWVTALALTATTTQAQTVSDDALAECQAANSSFTSVKDCLPDTDVALAMLKAVAAPDFYGEAGATIVSACEAINETSVARWACTKNALSDAAELLTMVGSPDKIEDQRFRGVSDPKTFERLEERHSAERSRFDKMNWGMTMYHPLK